MARNLNDSIQIRLTDAGRRYLINKMEKEADLMGNKVYVPYTRYFLTEWTEHQFHVIMHDFSEFSAQAMAGCSVPFEWRLPGES